MTSLPTALDGSLRPLAGNAGAADVGAAEFESLVAFRPSAIPYSSFSSAIRAAGGLGAGAGAGGFWGTMGRILEMGLTYGIAQLQERKAEITERLVTPEVWARLTPEAQQELMDTVKASMARVPNGFGGGVGPEEHEPIVREALDRALRRSMGPPAPSGAQAPPPAATPLGPPQPTSFGPSERDVRLDGPNRDYDIEVRRTSEDGRNVYRAHYRIGGVDYAVPIPDVHSLDQAERGAQRLFHGGDLPGLDPNAPASYDRPSRPAAGRPAAPASSGSPAGTPQLPEAQPAGAASPSVPVDPGPSTEELLRRSAAEAERRLSERVRVVGAFQQAESGLGSAMEAVRGPGFGQQPATADIQRFLDALSLFQAAKKEYSRSQGVTEESLVSLQLGPAVQLLDELRRSGRVVQDPSGRLRAQDPPQTSSGEAAGDRPGQTGRRDEERPSPAPAPAPVTGSPSGTDRDDQDDLEVGVRTIVGYSPRAEKVFGATTYIDPADEPGEADRNLILYRLLHSGGPSDGHDAIHLISGFGLNPISADRAGAPFPATALELTAQGAIPAEQRNVNGILIENITDGLWLAMRDVIGTEAILADIPENLRSRASFVLSQLAEQTGYGIPQGPLKAGSDFERHAQELETGGLGRIVTEPGMPPAQIYYPERNTGAPELDNVTPHYENFKALLQSNPAVREELKRNLVQYLTYVSDIEVSTNRTGQLPPPSRIEIRVSPESTEAMIGTAIAGLEELQRAHPGSPAIPELINFYRSVLQSGQDGSPQISRAPEPSPVA